MAKRIRSWNKAKYEYYIKAGRGQGTGSVYLPWVSIHDFSSLGMVSRIVGYKSGRVHHFLSRNELDYFFMLEWSDKVMDIREQFPLLDVEMAVDIAQKSGINYPRDNVSGFPYILTCDFMITTVDGLKARTIKCLSELQNKRTIEKLEIERRYWQYMGIDWKIVTENQIPKQKCLNIEWLYTSVEIPEYLDLQRLRIELRDKIHAGIPIGIALEDFEAQNGLPPGSGILLLKNMLWHKELRCDMEVPLVKTIFSNRRRQGAND